MTAIETRISDTPVIEKPQSGLFIVLEGIDNCGKTTQSQMLKEYLEAQGQEVLLTREPGGTADGEKIRELLLNRRKEDMLHPVTQTLLFYASRMEFLRNLVGPAIKRGAVVISDRFEASTYVYQGVTQGVDGGLINQLSMNVVGDWRKYKPDLYGIIDITVEESRRRQFNQDNAGQLLVYEQMDDEFQEKIRQGYIEYAEGYPTSHVMWSTWYSGENATLINGMRDSQEIHKELIGLVEEAREKRTKMDRAGEPRNLD